MYTDGRIECQFTNAAMANFLGTGDWLEVYTWSEVEKAGFAETLDGYANFWEQAQLRHIIVVTTEDLPNIGEILKKQAIDPDFPRI